MTPMRQLGSSTRSGATASSRSRRRMAAGSPRPTCCRATQARRSASRSRPKRHGGSGRRASAPRTADAISPSSTGSPMATTPPTGSSAAAVSCIRASASPSRRRKASGSRTPRRRFSVLPPTAARRLLFDAIEATEGQTLETVLQSAWNDSVETGSVQALTVNGLPAAVATARGKEWIFRLAAIRVGSTTYRLVLASRGQPEALERAFRASLELDPSARRRGDAGRPSAEAPARDRRPERYGREPCRAHARREPGGRALPGAERARARRAGEARRALQDHRRIAFTEPGWHVSSPGAVASAEKSRIETGDSAGPGGQRCNSIRGRLSGAS